MPVTTRSSCTSDQRCIRCSAGRTTPAQPAAVHSPRLQSLIGVRDRSGVVAQAINEPRHRDEVDHAGNGYRQQPGDRHLPAWIPTNHHSPLYASVARAQQTCKAIGGEKQGAHRAWSLLHKPNSPQQSNHQCALQPRLRFSDPRSPAGHHLIKALTAPDAGRSPRESAIGRRNSSFSAERPFALLEDRQVRLERLQRLLGTRC
jgi:hypothetical protein